MVPLVVLPLLNEDTLTNIPIEEGEEDVVDKEDVAHPYGSNIEIAEATNSEATNSKGKGKKRTRSSERLKATGAPS